MGDRTGGVVRGDEGFFGLGIGIFADEGPDVGVGGVKEGRRAVREGGEVVEEEEGGGGVFEGGGEEGVIGAEEGQAVQRGA